jgi:hypothetical protein
VRILRDAYAGVEVRLIKLTPVTQDEVDKVRACCQR